MDTFEPRNAVALPTDLCKRYQGIAFDGCFFYLTMPQDCKIYRLHRDFTPSACFEVDKPYSSICYDSSENCFWASVDKLGIVLYKLNREMKEIDRLQIKGCAKPCAQIEGLSYNCEHDTLLVAFKDFIAEISKEGCCVRILQEICTGQYTGVLSIAPYYAVIRRCGPTQEVIIYSADDCVARSFCVPAVYTLEDLLFDPCCARDRSVLPLIFLAAKHCCYPRILYFEIDSCGLDGICCCNYEVCRPCRDGECNEICDLIESIALVETALSHILNAEGEKLQRAVEISKNICDLIEIDKSVYRTIVGITQLEHVLYAKLDAASSLCEEPCHGKPPFDWDQGPNWGRDPEWDRDREPEQEREWEQE